MTEGGWNDPAGAVLVAVFAAPQGDGVDRVAVAMNRRPRTSRSACRRRAPAWRGAPSSTPSDPEAPERRIALADRARLHARSSLILAEARTASGGPGSGAPSAETIDALAGAAGIAAEWWDVRGKRTIVSPETKIALLAALGLEAGSEAEARDSLTQAHRRDAASPPALFARAAARRAAESRLCATCRAQSTRASRREDGATIEWRVEAGDGVRRGLPDGRAVAERTIALPALPVGRYRLIVDGVECALTVAPPKAFSSDGGAAQAVRRRRPALRAATRGRRPSRPGDRRLLDSGARRREGRRRRGGLFRRQPAAHAVPARPGPRESLLSLRSPLPRSDI